MLKQHLRTEKYGQKRKRRVRGHALSIDFAHYFEGYVEAFRVAPSQALFLRRHFGEKKRGTFRGWERLKRKNGEH